MHLTRAELAKIDLESLRPYAATPEFFEPKNHYRLLAHLSTLAQGSIIDIGTYTGDSALALSYGNVGVDSFDIADTRPRRDFPTHVRFHLADLCDPATRESWRGTLLTSGLIFIDIDPHEGMREFELVEWLRANHYPGIIVLDDIWHFKPMRDNLWYRIEPQYRTDVTAIGHWSGTGIVSFGKRVQFEDERDTSNWTLVTGYFDLTGKDDASPELKARPAEHYIDQHGSSTLSLDKNLIVFCDKATEPKVWAKRPAWLHKKTRVIVQEFEAFPLNRYRDKIIANRGGPWCPTDPRNTASYYLFCMARYAMLKRSIQDNPFYSSHFAWINICIERMGFNNLVHLNEALSVQRDKFSTCFIDYIPKKVVDDLPGYFGEGACVGRCSMCSGFFTGSAEYMREVCDRLEEKFKWAAGWGYGHADEQLYPMVYYERPDLFDWYVGDYAEMITNYAHVYERPEQPVRNLIRNSLAAGDLEVCRRACDMVLDSLANGRCTLGSEEHTELVRARAACALPVVEQKPATARQRYLNLLKSCLTRTAFEKLSPDQLALRREGQDWPPDAETMIGHARLDNIEQCANTIFQESVPGDFLEAGVWRGGACIFMRALIDEQPDRRVWVADSFEGLPPSTHPVDIAQTGFIVPSVAIAGGESDRG